MSLKSKVPRKGRWTAWSGGKSDLATLGSMVDSLTIERRETLLSTLKSAPEGPNGSSVEIGVVERFSASAGYNDGQDTQTGSIEEVVDVIDPRAIGHIYFMSTIKYGTIEESLSVFFFNSIGFHAVHVDVVSSDKQWALKSLAVLSEEVKRRVPQWSWIRTSWATTLLGIVTYALTATAVFLAFRNSVDSTSVALLIGSVAGLAAQILIGLRRVKMWLFPPVEITPETTTTGGRRIAIFATLLASVPLGLLVNAISG